MCNEAKLLPLVQSGELIVCSNGDLYHGRLRGVWLKQPRKIVLKPHQDTGYVSSTKSVGGEKVRYLVHRLVYLVFRGHIPEGRIVDHIDNIKSHNSPFNLQAITPKENVCRGQNTKILGEARWSSKITADNVRFIRESIKNAKHGVNELGRMLNISSSQVSRIASRKYWKHI